MIRHICMFKLKDENKSENIATALEMLEIMKEIPLIKRFEVVTNDEEAPDSNYELSLIFDFDSIEDLNEYQKHPEHVKFGKFISSARENRACIDYKLD